MKNDIVKIIAIIAMAAVAIGGLIVLHELDAFLITLAVIYAIYKLVMNGR